MGEKMSKNETEKNDDLHNDDVSSSCDNRVSNDQRLLDDLHFRKGLIWDSATKMFGLYPQAVIVGNVRTERTPWQEGWNAAFKSLVKDFIKLENFLQSLPVEKRRMILGLMQKDDLTLTAQEEEDGGNVEMHVNCNDLFAWACADSEQVEDSELESLFQACKDDPIHGAEKWCCKKRNMQPQRPIVEDWKAKGAWDAEMEALPINPSS